ncbi:hypothetical protein [uncultured Mediterranean phage uvMED]|nr:hypothetical protein [uncultured phage MedDCM-OCT-S11-C149]BAQ92020.1 hypothetical protein [uncultured Mediterranean phage uvMED]BAQ92149.1 hypothetical protein [uncultured Mediterranean phage uvMED]BAQ92252.1 hypothetical protein [uncultured Mediterranean phage uvMED]
MNQEHLNRLDFKNGQLEKWLNECPFPITNFRQLCFQTAGQKQVELLLDIPIEQTAANLAHYGLKIDQKTADLEMQYIKADKRHKELIAESIKLEETGNVLQQKKVDDECHKAWKLVHELGKELTELCEKEEKV